MDICLVVEFFFAGQLLFAQSDQSRLSTNKHIMNFLEFPIGEHVQQLIHWREREQPEAATRVLQLQVLASLSLYLFPFNTG
jgi:hypothetical protein